MASNNNILELKNITMRFSGLTAVDDLSFEIRKNEIVGLIGPNGAGKTTVFNCVTQFYKSYTGDILFNTEAGEVIDLRDLKVTDVVDVGIVRTFQNVELIPDLSVLDNVLIGGHKQFSTTLFQHIFSTPKARKEEATMREKALGILRFMGLEHLKDFHAKGQPYGILKKIEIARTLMSDPKLIIFDEPAAGLNEVETDELETIIYNIRDEYDASILLIEHDMGFVMNITDRVCAINFGKFLAMDTPKAIQSNALVQEAYLGKEDSDHADE